MSRTSERTARLQRKFAELDECVVIRGAGRYVGNKPGRDVLIGLLGGSPETRATVLRQLRRDPTIEIPAEFEKSSPGSRVRAAAPRRATRSRKLTTRMSRASRAS